MTARTIVGLLGLVVLFGIAVYLLFQIPWEYTAGGILALAGLLAVIGADAPDTL